jgi:hypothetical protein
MGMDGVRRPMETGRAGEIGPAKQPSPMEGSAEGVKGLAEKAMADTGATTTGADSKERKKNVTELTNRDDLPANISEILKDVSSNNMNLADKFGGKTFKKL